MSLGIARPAAAFAPAMPVRSTPDPRLTGEDPARIRATIARAPLFAALPISAIEDLTARVAVRKVAVQAAAFPPEVVSKDQLPQDKGVPRACNQQRAIDTVGTLATNPNLGSPQFPIPTGTTVSGDGACPNKWAAKQGIAYQQLTGFQTVNNLETATSIDSALWNLTANTNATYLEAYEKPLWAFSHDLGTGPLAAKLNPAPYFLASGGTAKNLYEWSKVLHWRRAQIAPWFPTNVYMANPFPTTFKRYFTPALPTTYYYINPRTCQTLPGHYMKLVVN